MKPIYKPKGAAAEYGDYAVNIYTGCPHRCFYCYASHVLHRVQQTFFDVRQAIRSFDLELSHLIERINFKNDKQITLIFYSWKNSNYTGLQKAGTIRR